MKKNPQLYDKIQGWNKRLKELILRYGTISGFAEKAGIKVQTFHAYFSETNGTENFPDIATLAHICDLLHVSIDYILRGTGNVEETRLKSILLETLNFIEEKEKLTLDDFSKEIFYRLENNPELRRLYQFILDCNNEHDMTEEVLVKLLYKNFDDDLIDEVITTLFKQRLKGERKIGGQDAKK